MNNENRSNENILNISKTENEQLKSQVTINYSKVSYHESLNLSCFHDLDSESVMEKLFTKYSELNYICTPNLKTILHDMIGNILEKEYNVDSLEISHDSFSCSSREFHSEKQFFLQSENSDEEEEVSSIPDSLGYSSFYNQNTFISNFN